MLQGLMRVGLCCRGMLPALPACMRPCPGLYMYVCFWSAHSMVLLHSPMGAAHCAGHALTRSCQLVGAPGCPTHSPGETGQPSHHLAAAGSLVSRGTPSTDPQPHITLHGAGRAMRGIGKEGKHESSLNIAWCRAELQGKLLSCQELGRKVKAQVAISESKPQGVAYTPLSFSKHAKPWGAWLQSWPSSCPLEFDVDPLLSPRGCGAASAAEPQVGSPRWRQRRTRCGDARRAAVTLGGRRVTLRAPRRRSH